MAEDQEVDVQLFITCRLCLDEPGLYQIVPLIKGQINYCFGIDIDPFDGLPQLICKKCKCILNEYHAIRNTFEEKQKQLRDRALKHNKLAKSVDLTAVQNEKSAAGDAVPQGNRKTSPDVTDVAPPEKSPASADVASPANCKKKRPSWKKEYNEHFVCAICSKGYLTEKSVKKHMTVHKTFTRKHEKVFKKCLTIQMNKIDKKKNATGRTRHVVYDKNKIISKRVTSNYYSFYLKKNYQENNETDENENVTLEELVKRESAGKRRLSESSDDVILKGKKRKSRRLFSNSSTQTVVLDVSKEEECIATTDTTQADNPKTPKETETAEAECINIDDTSSDCPKPELKRVPQRQQAKAKVGDYKAIQSIVTMCHKNYIKKIQSETNSNDKPSFSESSLKHKVLSLGRKVINKQGFSCTGILRYMEHKDLTITWKPTSIAMQSKGSNYVRIMTKLKSCEDSENENVGWKNINDISLFRDSSDKENNICEKLTKKNETIASDAVIPLEPDRTEEVPSAASACETSDLNFTYILSETPVPTSKQTIIVKPIIKPTEATVLPQTVESEGPQVEDSHMLMPIITSTTSLSQGKRIVSVTGIPVPRIKVKPASELMTERALSNQEASEDLWAFNVRHSSTRQLFTDTAVDPGPSTSGLQNGTIPDVSQVASLGSNQTVTQSTTVETNRNRNQNLASVILNSPELPNTKTESPFNYFRTLLLFHELQLLELNEELSDDFHCLVRFKLLLKQLTKKTITVLLSLFCSNNKFCFTFKDANLKKFDPNKLPGFWQWELLKVYKGTVVDKILLNASKLGKEDYEFTKHFLCLLKSIDLVPEP